jgi:lambda repressor-like predicted transcriptional regulator
MAPASVKVKIRMLERGQTYAKIAEPLGVTVPAVCRVMLGKEKSPRIRKAIATALGWPASRIWADAGSPRKAKAAASEQGAA